MAVRMGATGAGSSSVSTAVQCAISSCRGIQCVLSRAGLPVSSAGEIAKGGVSGQSLLSVTVIVWGSKRMGLLLSCQTGLELTTLHEARGFGRGHEAVLDQI